MFKFTCFVRLVAGCLVTCSGYAEALASPITCRWVSKQQCDAGALCKPLSPAVWAVVDRQTEQYQRCDRQGCDSYEAIVTIGPGAFTVFDLPGRGTFLKVGPDGTAAEVVSLGTSVLVSHGRCQ